MELDIYKINGEKTGRKVQLDDTVFGIEPNDHAIYLDIKQYRANQRQGTHSSKERSQLSGSTRKLKRQKGTGTARMGDINSPILRGGARAFGPHPRDYSFKLNKKLKRLARKSALAYKVQEENVMIVEDFTFELPKTKNYLKFASDLKIDGIKSLLILNTIDNNIYLSARNIKGANIKRAVDINTYELLAAKKLIISESSIKSIEEVLTK
ncbi:MAG: 50S ribosomal protein L4 [Bacteroidetes bacterium CG2_30_33_31]|nr:MAG: 50S ribosomal protein L4 [Bacteroidetes bacterium CG2_30_33_31]